MAQRPATLKDIARSLDLSISTVEAALHHRSDISVRTRERVLAKARELNYRPNMVARSLVTRQTRVLGVLVPDLSRSFFTEVIKGIDSVASDAGYNLLLCNTGEDATREEQQLETLIGKQVDGLIVASAHKAGTGGLRQRLECSGIPFVLIDRSLPEVPFVGGDDVKIGYLATRHLIDQGYRRIAHLRGPNVSTAIGRLKGYTTAIREAGLQLRRSYVIEASYHDERSGFTRMQDLLRLATPPDAVFAASDPIAIGALDAILRSGRRVPDEVGIIGVGNHRYTEYLQVPLSTVDQNRSEIGQQAAALLLHSIRSGQGAAAPVILIEPRLIARSSSLRLAQASGDVLSHAR
jgi:LacI family transcriptional regulator